MASGVTVHAVLLGCETDPKPHPLPSPCKLTGGRCGLGRWFKSLQGRGRKLPHTSLGQEGALDGLQLWSGLGVLQGRVGGCHRTLTEMPRIRFG